MFERVWDVFRNKYINCACLVCVKSEAWSHGTVIGKYIDKRSIKIFTLGIVGNFPFVYSSVSRTYIMPNSKVNKYIMSKVSK